VDTSANVTELNRFWHLFAAELKTALIQKQLQE